MRHTVETICYHKFAALGHSLLHPASARAIPHAASPYDNGGSDGQRTTCDCGDDEVKLCVSGEKTRKMIM